MWGVRYCGGHLWKISSTVHEVWGGWIESGTPMPNRPGIMAVGLNPSHASYWLDEVTQSCGPQLPLG